jgi:hypothetical protein
MSRKQIIYIIFLILLVIGWAWVDQSARNTDWSPTFYAPHKIPFGTFVLNDNLENLFPATTIKSSSKSFYKMMNSEDSLLTSACVITVTKQFNADSLELSKMNQFIEKGNTVFLATQYFPSNLLKKYGLKVKFNFKKQKNRNSTLSYKAATDNSQNTLSFKKMQAFSYFELEKNTNIKIIGKENSSPCFVEKQIGKGRLLLHAQPFAFTNYHILYNHKEYAEWVFSTIQPETKTVIWDNYHTPYSMSNKSPLKIILANRALKSALYLSLFLLILYILIFSKRKQQIIPIVRPEKNLSLNFIDTIGRLYFQKGNHRNLVEKQFTQFNFFVKTKFYISNVNNRDDFIERLSLKSGIKKSIIKNIYNYYSKIKTKDVISEHELHTFYGYVKQFQKRIKH